MPTIRKVTSEDFENVYPLLLDFNNPNLRKDDWKRLFIPPWYVEENYCGYALFDNEKVVGFLGYIFSKRIIKGNEYKFCNLSSWILKEEYRGQGLSLFYPVLDLKDYTITDFSPNDSVFKMFNKRYKFKVLETGLVMSFPVPGIEMFQGKDKCNVFIDDQIVREDLDENDLRLYTDHIQLNCIHVLAKTAEGNCYLVAKRKRLRKLPYIEILYIGNLTVFIKFSEIIKVKICMKYKTVGILIEKRHLRGNKLRCSITRLPYFRKLYKSDFLENYLIDNMYSEKLLL